MIIVSWDGHTEINDGVNCTAVMERSWGLPTIEPLTAKRHEVAPVITGVRYTDDHTLPPLGIQIEKAPDVEPIRGWLHRWFDGKDGRSRPLVVCDGYSGSTPIRPRVIYALPMALLQKEGSGGWQFVALLKPDGVHDPHYRWRDTADVTDTWNITASGQTRVINNTGQDETYPVIKLTPTSAKSSGFTYKRWIPIKWRNEVGSALYPVEITNGGLNTATLVTGGKMKANGDDVIVEVNGARANRWLGGMNTSSTKIWIGLPFQYIAPVNLESSLGAGAVTSVEVVGDISNWPSAGIFMIGNEAFTYTSKVDNKRQFVGITRGAHGTTAASHSAGAQMDLIQHSVYLLYGNAAAPAYEQPSLQRPPIFDLTASTNGSWVYTHFGESAINRMGAWQHNTQQSLYSSPYSTGGAPPKSFTSPWDWLGVLIQRVTHIPMMGTVSFSNICGIDSVNITAGELYFANNAPVEWWFLRHYGHVNGVAQTAANTSPPGSRDTVTSWTQNVSLTGLAGLATAYSFLFRMIPSTSTDELSTSFAGVNNVTVTLHSANLPVVTLGAEQSNYAMTATITNVTTGDAITVSFGMALDKTLEIDTGMNSVVYLADGSTQGQAVRRIGTPRRFWLPLQPGNNTLRFDDAGTGNVTFETVYRRRYYT